VILKIISSRIPGSGEGKDLRRFGPQSSFFRKSEVFIILTVPASLKD
jgi:hypothetical protein